MREREALPKEEGDAVRENKAMHEENFWINWLREDEKSKEERKVEAEEKLKGKRGKERRRKQRIKR